MMANLNLYLNFKGNAEEAFHFYRSIFGGEFSGLERYKNMPGSEQLTPNEQNKIMHIAFPVGKNLTFMGSDIIESMGQKLVIGNNCSIMIDAESKEEADNFFEKLSAGGKVEMSMQNMFWNAYFGSFADRFGVQWMVNYSY